MVPSDQRISLDKILVHPWIFMDLPEATYKVDYGQLKKYTRFSKVQSLNKLVQKNSSIFHRFSVTIKVNTQFG